MAIPPDSPQLRRSESPPLPPAEMQKSDAGSSIAGASHVHAVSREIFSGAPAHSGSVFSGSARELTYKAVSVLLNGMDDEAVEALLEGAAILHEGIGGEAGIVEVAGKRVFFKKVALTELERLQPGSTSNLFGLPPYFQYGIGSSGFGVQREVKAHEETTRWVVEGQSPNFPMMYHKREVSRPKPVPPTEQEKQGFEEHIQYWNGSETIRARCEAIENAPSSMVLFLEYVPKSLSSWLEEKLKLGGEEASAAVKMIEANLKITTAFLKANHLIHFDGHFRNILTDGEQLYFTDFGLSTSANFSLSDEERLFFEQHIDYDRYYTLAQLATDIAFNVFGEEAFETALQEYAEGVGAREIEPAIGEVLTRYAPLAVVMNKFFEELRKDKSTPFPIEALRKADPENPS